MLAVHGHHGATELRWLEPAPATPSAEMAHLFGDHRTGRPPIAIAEPAQGPNRARGWAGARHLR